MTHQKPLADLNRVLSTLLSLNFYFKLSLISLSLYINIYNIFIKPEVGAVHRL